MESLRHSCRAGRNAVSRCGTYPKLNVEGNPGVLTGGHRTGMESILLQRQPSCRVTGGTTDYTDSTADSGKHTINCFQVLGLKNYLKAFQKGSAAAVAHPKERSNILLVQGPGTNLWCASQILRHLCNLWSSRHGAPFFESTVNCERVATTADATPRVDPAPRPAR